MRRFGLLKNNQVKHFIDLELKGRFQSLINYVSSAGDPDGPIPPGDEGTACVCVCFFFFFL
jgi:hypothetical protein